MSWNWLQISRQSRQVLQMRFISYFNAFFSATLRAVHKVGYARSATRHTVGIRHLTSTRVALSITHNAKYEDVAQAKWRACKTMRPSELVLKT